MSATGSDLTVAIFQAVIDESGAIISYERSALRVMADNMVRDLIDHFSEAVWPGRVDRLESIPSEPRQFLIELATCLPAQFWELDWFVILRDHICNDETAGYYKPVADKLEPWQQAMCYIKFWRNFSAHCAFSEVAGHISRTPKPIRTLVEQGTMEDILKRLPKRSYVPKRNRERRQAPKASLRHARMAATMIVS
jgi:hypothetical protein